MPSPKRAGNRPDAQAFRDQPDEQCKTEGDEGSQDESGDETLARCSNQPARFNAVSLPNDKNGGQGARDDREMDRD